MNIFSCIFRKNNVPLWTDFYFVFNMLLQVPNFTPKVLPPDSVREVTRNIVYQMHNDPETFWHGVAESAIQFGLKVLAALLIYAIGIWLIGWVKKLLKRHFDRKHTEPTMASFVTSFVQISLTVLIVVISVTALGVDTTSLAALLAAGGMAIGMALSGTVQNFAGGMMLMTFKPFKAGDMIEAQGFKGKVVETTITTTKILTPDNRVVILPNGALSNGAIDNYSARPLRRVDWTVSVDYGVDAEKCRQTILDMVNANPKVLNAKTNVKNLYKEFDMELYQLKTVNYRMDAIPDPFVALLSLNENDITFVVRAWVRNADYWDVFFALQEQFYTELPKHGFTFAYPHVDVTMVKENSK